MKEKISIKCLDFIPIYIMVILFSVYDNSVSDLS